MSRDYLDSACRRNDLGCHEYAGAPKATERITGGGRSIDHRRKRRRCSYCRTMRGFDTRIATVLVATCRGGYDEQDEKDDPAQCPAQHLSVPARRTASPTVVSATKVLPSTE